MSPATADIAKKGDLSSTCISFISHGPTPNFGISKMKVPNRFVDMSLKDLGFSSPRDKYGLAVMAIRRGKDITLNPDGDDRLQAGDWLVLAGRDELIDNLDL